MTQRGTKIQKSKLNRKIVGHKRVIGQRKQNFFRAFCGLWVMNKNKSKGGENTIIPHGQPRILIPVDVD